MIVVLKRGNLFLYALVITLAIYIVAAPYLPMLAFAIQKAEVEPQYKGYTASQSGIDYQEELKDIPSENRLVIPEIEVDAQIYAGDNSALENGPWRNPKTSTPERGGNTVIAAHRFLYTNGPNTFYHLDKVEEGDLITVFWEGREYVYEVTSIFEVEPTAIEIEDNTEEAILTLYTCAPLWTSEKRLVVRSKLIYPESL